MYRPAKFPLPTKTEIQRLKVLLRGYRKHPTTVVFQGAWGSGMITVARLFQRGALCP